MNCRYVDGVQNQLNTWLILPCTYLVTINYHQNILSTRAEWRLKNISWWLERTERHHANSRPICGAPGVCVCKMIINPNFIIWLWIILLYLSIVHESLLNLQIN